MHPAGHLLNSLDSAACCATCLSEMSQHEFAVHLSDSARDVAACAQDVAHVSIIILFLRGDV